MPRQPVSCPVCGRLITEPLLENFHISAQGDGIVHDVNAMKAFQCEEEGHIFFIRAADLDRAAVYALPPKLKRL
ncbi:MAG TPA: hypothetical protein VJ756_09270 [Terriglobales bacterium]|nr:hypothetical protein [Terriglobales bacterium]